MPFSAKRRHHTFRRVFSLQKKRGAGFTLIEILLSIAIMGILTTIVFSGLRSEQQRSAAKDAADRLQVEITGLQNMVQSAVALPTKFCTRNGTYQGQGKPCTTNADCLIPPVQGRCIEGAPTAYGLSLVKDAETYDIFADMYYGASSPNGKREIGGTSYDIATASAKSFGTNIIASRITVNAIEATRLDISFSGTNGKMVLYREGGIGTCTVAARDCLTARIVLKNTTTGVCYRIDADATSGVVTKRQYSSQCD